jgi:hypothetical protein
MLPQNILRQTHHGARAPCRAVRDAVLELLEEAYKVDPNAVMNHLANTHLKPAKRAHICAVLNVEEPQPSSVTPVSYSVSRATTRDEVSRWPQQARAVAMMWL